MVGARVVLLRCLKLCGPFPSIASSIRLSQVLLLKQVTSSTCTFIESILPNPQLRHIDFPTLNAAVTVVVCTVWLHSGLLVVLGCLGQSCLHRSIVVWIGRASVTMDVDDNVAVVGGIVSIQACAVGILQFCVLHNHAAEGNLRDGHVAFRLPALRAEGWREV